jgi:hypothetical protein
LLHIKFPPEDLKDLRKTRAETANFECDAGGIVVRKMGVEPGPKSGGFFEIAVD